MKNKFLFIIITAIWLILMGMLMQRFYTNAPIGSTVDASKLPASFLTPQWMGVYMNQEKIGYSFTQFALNDSGYDLKQEIAMKFLVMGYEREVNAKIDAELDRHLRLIAFNATMASEFDISVSGKMDGNLMQLTLDTGSGPQAQTIRMAEPPRVQQAALISALVRDLEPGDKFQTPVMEPTSMTVESSEIEFLARGPLSAMGEMHDTYKLRSNFKGITILTWITPTGEVLKQESSAGFTMMREPKEEAQTIGVPSLDMIYQSSVPFNLELPRMTEYLKVELTGISTKGLDLDGGRQTLVGKVLEINRESPMEETTQEELAAFLKDGLLVQSSAPEIQAKSLELLAGLTDTESKARRLNDWLYRAMEKVPIVTLPSALTVLKNLRGDCNEHTVLFTALARAANIPTRVAAGLVYKDKAFYYHAWPEVYLKNKWVAIDPTFGQFPADASHIRLTIGDLQEQMRLLPSIGKIELKGISYR